MKKFAEEDFVKDYDIILQEKTWYFQRFGLTKGFLRFLSTL
jgi:hypothetical protein